MEKTSKGQTDKIKTTLDIYSIYNSVAHYSYSLLRRVSNNCPWIEEHLLTLTLIPGPVQQGRVEVQQGV